MQSLTLRFTSEGPLYHQLYARLADDIRAGCLAAGEKLPSKRRLAEQLHISLNTVDTAYQMLVAEGYLAARPRSGFVVCRLEHPVPSAAQHADCH
ncbi:MAG: winged helix-turn-helix domain-containing protein, partial [Ruthenibacterium sp.]